MEPRIGFEPTTYALRMRPDLLLLSAFQACGGNLVAIYYVYRTPGVTR